MRTEERAGKPRPYMNRMAILHFKLSFGKINDAYQSPGYGGKIKF